MRSRIMKTLNVHSCNTVNEFIMFKWLTVLLFGVCNGFSVTFEHPTSNRYNIYVHCTSSVYFIIDDLLHFVMSHGLHFVCTELLTCCKICTHKMATEKCFFSKWLCSILASHSTAFPLDNMGPWHRVTVITDMQQIHPTSCTILLPLSFTDTAVTFCVLLNKSLCDILCGENKIWWLQFSEVIKIFDIKWNIISPPHEDKPSTATAWDYQKCDRL